MRNIACEMTWNKYFHVQCLQNEVELVTENVQDTTKVQLNHRDITEMPFSIGWTNSTLFTPMEQQNAVVCLL